MSPMSPHFKLVFVSLCILLLVIYFAFQGIFTVPGNLAFVCLVKGNEDFKVDAFCVLSVIREGGASMPECNAIESTDRR